MTEVCFPTFKDKGHEAQRVNNLSKVTKLASRASIWSEAEPRPQLPVSSYWASTMGKMLGTSSNWLLPKAKLPGSLTIILSQSFSNSQSEPL